MKSRIGRALAVAILGTLTAASCLNSSQTETGAERVSGRIVSLVPAVTEMLFAMGAGDRVVGVSDFDTYPPEVYERPRVGALINPNVEKIFELQPDLVITYGTQSSLAERLGVAGIRLYPFVHSSIPNVLAYIRRLGLEIGLAEEGSRLANDIDRALEAVRSEASEARPRVLLAHSRDIGTMGSFYSGGGQSFFDELITIAGGQNIFGDVEDDSIQPSLEEVFRRQPEVIIELLPSERGGEAETARRIEDWMALESVPAVRDGRVYVLAADYLLLVGPRLHLAAQALADAIRAGSEGQ